MDQRVRLVGSEFRLGCDEHPDTRDLVGRRPELHPERREDVDHQRRNCRSVHRVCQDRRREVFCVPRRTNSARAKDRSRGAQAGHSRIVDLPAGPGQLHDPGGEPAGRAGQGTSHCVQRAECRPLQTRCSVRGWGAPCTRAHDSLCQGAQGIRKSDRRVRLDSTQDLDERDATLRRREHGLSHGGHDRRRAGIAGRAAATNRARSRSASRSMQSSARS